MFSRAVSQTFVSGQAGDRVMRLSFYGAFDTILAFLRQCFISALTLTLMTGVSTGMGRRRELRREIQTPVRIFGTDSSGQVFSTKAITVNVSQQGIELSGVEPRLSLDEIIGLIYGKNRVHFRVK